MGIFQLKKIMSELETIYTEKVDLSDCIKDTSDNQRNKFLTRALSAYAIQALCLADPSEIVKCICDGYGDNGIDCIYYDDKERILYVVQSKWNYSGKGSPDLGDMDKFIQGVRDLISCRFSKFNAKVMDRSNELENILYNSKKLRVNLVLVHSGDDLSKHIRDRVNDFLNELNDTSDSFSFSHLDQAALFAYIQEEEMTKVNLDEILLTEWGKKSAPKLAYYGAIDGTQIAKWYQQFGKNLFSKNIRMILPDSDINSEIRKSLEQEPDDFWYYNNGITLIASKIGKRPINGEERNFGIFDCEDISIINGAQTVGTIGKYAIENEFSEEVTAKLAKIKVHIRLIQAINLESSDVFVDNVTKANNRQNKVENRDFVALEVNQKRLSSELKLLGINYSIVRSEDNLRDDFNFDVEESTKSISNAYNIAASTAVHREPNKVWSDITHSRYRQLFNSGTKAIYVWNTVKVQRCIDQNLSELKKSFKGDDKALLTYGEDNLSCIIFSKIKSNIEHDIVMEKGLIESFNIKEMITACIPIYKEEVERIKKGIPTIFKNFEHCEEIYNRATDNQNFVALEVFKS